MVAVPIPVLRASQLILIPAVDEDLPALSRHWNTPAVRRLLWDDNPVAVDTIRKAIAASERDFAQAGYGIWTVRRTEDGPVIGTCALRKTADGEVDLLFRLDPAVWEWGLATEAAQAVLGGTRPAGPVLHSPTPAMSRRNVFWPGCA